MTDYIACGGSCPSGSRRSSRASPRRAPRPAARCSAARRPSTPACWSPTSTTWPARPPGSSSATASSAPTGSGRRRGPRDGVLRPALQRLLPGPPRACRPPAGRSTGTCRELGRTLGEELLVADPDLLPRLPGPDRRGRGARDEPHHRRRPRQQPGPGRPGSLRGDGSTGRPGRRRRSSAWSATSAASRSPTSRRRSTWASAWSRCCPRTPSARPSSCSPRAGCGPGSADPWPPAGVRYPGAGQPRRLPRLTLPRASRRVNESPHVGRLLCQAVSIG